VASTVKESCYSDRIGWIGESKIRVECVFKITKSKTDAFRWKFDNKWWMVDAFNLGGSSLLASTVGGLRSEEAPTAQKSLKKVRTPAT
jgi:hypothetical protein